MLLPASLCGVTEPDLLGVADPEAGLAADESRTAAFAALGNCLDRAEKGRLVRLTAWLRAPMIICLGLLVFVRAASSNLWNGCKQLQGCLVSSQDVNKACGGVQHMLLMRFLVWQQTLQPTG